MRSCSASCRLFDTCCDPAVPFSLKLPHRKDGLFGDKICNSPWLVNQLALLKEFAQQQVENSAGFVFSEDLPTFFGVLRCFGVFRTIPDIVFKANVLPTDDFFDR